MRGGMGVGLVVLVAVLANCGSSVEPSELTGTWDATALRFTNLANSAQSVDIIAGGGAFTLSLAANNSYQIVATEPGSTPDTTGGTWQYTSLDGLTLTETGQSDGTDIDVSLSGTTLTVSSTDGITFDFGSGEVAARLDGTLVRR